MTKKTVKKGGLQGFAAQRKQDIIVNVENASTTGIVIKWLLTNKVSVILAITAMFFYGRAYVMENDLIKKRNQELIEERDGILDKTKELQAKVDELEQNSIKANQLNNTVSSQAEALTASQKRRKILQQINSLKIKRGLFK